MLHSPRPRLNDVVATLQRAPHDPEAWVALGRYAWAAGQQDSARRYFAQAHNILCAAGDVAAAEAMARTIVDTVDARVGLELIADRYLAQRTFVVGSAYDDAALRMMALHRDLVAIYDNAGQSGNFAAPSGFSTGHLVQQSANQARALPMLLVVAMPGAGDALRDYVGKAYRTPAFGCAVDGFPRSTVIGARLAKLATGGLWDITELDATAANLDALAQAGVRKITLALADPRRAVLAWAESFESRFGGDAAIRVPGLWATPPLAYAAFDAAARLNWHVHNSYSAFALWAAEWADVVLNDRRFAIHVVDVAQRAGDAATVAANLFAFHDVPGAARPTSVAAPVVPWREDWVNSFTAEQVAFMNRRLAPAAQEAFGWQ